MQIAAMRDVMLHSYDKVDLDEVGNTVRRDLPQVMAQLRPLTSDLDDGHVG